MSDGMETNRPIEQATETMHAGTGTAYIIKRISWPAIFAGTLVALGTELLFIAFGFFVGLRMVNPGQPNPFSGVNAWSLIWYLVTSFCALFCGGWVAARLSGNPYRGAGMLHGIVTWGLATVSGFAFLTMLFGNLIGASVGLLRSAALASVAAAQTAGPGEAARMQEQAAQALQGMNVPPQQLAGSVAHQLSGLFLLLWIGVLIAAGASLLGGWLGRPRVTTPTATQV